MKEKSLTPKQGVPVTDNQNSLSVGERGPVLLQDVHLIEKLAHFDRERIPERVVHAKGAGAHGFFAPYPTSPDANRFWDFVSLPPESTHMIPWLFSDRGTIRSYRTIEGFGVHTYVWVNAEGKAIYVKYHWKPAR